MTLIRHHDWPERLARMIDSARALEFEWGRFDCALHVANCIRCMVTSGVDVAAEHRGKYSDEAGAIAIFSSASGGTDLAAFAATIAAQYGMEEVPPTFARRGDVVWIDNDTPHGALGIVSLDGRFATCVWQNGLLHVRMHRWKRAWRVG